MWIDLMLWWCRLFGYASCSQASTFEAIALAAAAFVAVIAAIAAVPWIFVLLLSIGQKQER